MITVTDTAISEIRSIMTKEENSGFHLRLGIGGGGCSGLQYFLGLDADVHETDESFEYDGFKMLIDKNSLPMLEGATLDFSDDPKHPGFVFNNPNAPKPAGCGSTCCC